MMDQHSLEASQPKSARCAVMVALAVEPLRLYKIQTLPACVKADRGKQNLLFAGVLPTGKFLSG